MALIFKDLHDTVKRSHTALSKKVHGGLCFHSSRKSIEEHTQKVNKKFKFLSLVIAEDKNKQVGNNLKICTTV